MQLGVHTDQLSRSKASNRPAPARSSVPPTHATRQADTGSLLQLVDDCSRRQQQLLLLVLPLVLLLVVLHQRFLYSPWT